MAQECAFCPSTATLTGEHLWSDWINDILPADKFIFTRRHVIGGESKTWERSSLNEKTRVACGICNSGRMSEIDNEAKRILRHLIIDLSPREISLGQLISIAAFGFKSAVVADRMMGTGDPMFTTAERYAFRERLRIPFGVFMWIGTLDSYNHGSFKNRHLTPNTRGPNDFGLYAFTYGAGHFVMQLAVARWAASDPKRSDMIPLDQQGEWIGRSAPFWPPVYGAVGWPLGGYLTRHTLDDFTDRWKNISLSVAE
jgi:hypothetical protein